MDGSYEVPRVGLNLAAVWKTSPGTPYGRALTVDSDIDGEPAEPGRDHDLRGNPRHPPIPDIEHDGLPGVEDRAHRATPVEVLGGLLQPCQREHGDESELRTPDPTSGSRPASSDPAHSGSAGDGRSRPRGFAPPDPPARSLARRFAGALRSRGSLAWLARGIVRPGGFALSSLTRIILPAVLIAAASELTSIRASANLDITFADVTATAGLQTRIHPVYGASGENKYILETTGTGVAFFDYDNDGWPDIFLVNGTTLEGFPRGQEPSNHLFRNKHDGTFEDVTRRAGLVQSGSGQGVAVADYDNDGFDDLFVTYWGQNRLYRNRGDGTFEDVTAHAGLMTDHRRWGTSAAFGDYDNDGFVDLYVANYIDFDPKVAPLPGAKVPGVNCSYRGFPVMCGPRGLQGERDRLYHNTGKGTFTDVTIQAGELDKGGYRGLGVARGDINNDGYPDIVVANDAQPNLVRERTERQIPRGRPRSRHRRRRGRPRTRGHGCGPR